MNNVKHVASRSSKKLTDDDRKIMGRFVRKYANNKFVSMKKCYEKMLLTYYTKETINEYIFNYETLPPDQCPSFRQFSYYIHTHMPKKENA